MGRSLRGDVSSVMIPIIPSLNISWWEVLRNSVFTATNSLRCLRMEFIVMRFRKDAQHVMMRICRRGNFCLKRVLILLEGERIWRRIVRTSEQIISVMIMVTILSVFLKEDAWGQWRRFTPTISTFFGHLDFDTIYESIENPFQGRGRDTTDIHFTEKITLGIGGYSYDPRFLIYNFSLGLGQREELFDGGMTEGWHYDSVEEYELKFLLLPRHKYPAEFYSRRRNPFVKARLTPGLSPISYQHGVNLYYKTRPLSLSLNYGLETLESLGDKTDTEILRFGGNHLFGPFSTSMSYGHSDSESTTTAESTTDVYFLNNNFYYKKLILRSGLGLQDFDQEVRGEAFSDRTFNWDERLQYKVFESLSTHANYSFLKIDRDTNAESSFNKNLSLGGGLVHRFYRSITTSYDITSVKTNSDAAESKILANALRVNYRKRIPWRSVLNTALSGRWSNTERTGPIGVIDEPHQASLIPPDDRFSLNETTVDENSIIVRIEEPGTGILFTLERGLHYLVETIGIEVFITIISVSDISPFIIGDGPFQLKVDYRIAQGDNEFKTTLYNAMTRLELFDRLLTPYYSYSTTKQEEIRGQIPGGPERSTTHTLGLTFFKQPISLGAEYQLVDSRFSPLRRWLFTADYRDDITSRVTLYIRGRYQNTDYREGEGDFQFREAHREELFIFNSRANMTLPKKNLLMFVGGNFSYRKTFSETLGLGFHSGLSWRLGLLTLNAGLSVTRFVNKLEIGEAVRDETFFFLKVRRELF